MQMPARIGVNLVRYSLVGLDLDVDLDLGMDYRKPRKPTNFFSLQSERSRKYAIRENHSIAVQV